MFGAECRIKYAMLANLMYANRIDVAGLDSWS